MARPTTSPISAPSSDPAVPAVGSGRRRASGFSLVELLVVIGIIGLLTAIALPVIFGAFSKGQKARTAADMQAISTALDAYKQDFGSYPPVTQDDTGFAVLVKALIGPYGDGVIDPTAATPAADTADPPTYAAGDYPAGSVVRATGALGADQYVTPVQTAVAPTAANSPWVNLGPGGINDGSDGAGFRARAGGRIRQGYLKPDVLKVSGSAILDSAGNPILYYPAAPGKPNPRLANGFVSDAGRPLYNANHNPFTAIGRDVPGDVKALQLAMGDADDDGQVDAGETPAHTGPYLLWSAGDDDQYGPVNLSATSTATEVAKALDEMDDVTNFR